MAPTAAALVSLCLLSVIGVAYCADNFMVQGRVYCDTCRIGFETPATTYIPGAKVKVECRSRTTGFITYKAEGMTDATGTYRIPVANDHQHEICESVLISSPQRGCAVMQAGRERASVVLTHNSGMPSSTRFANALGFVADRPLALCAQLVQQYELDETEV
ncbi:Pollen-specific protein C13 [Nymphaea thermarum]|nr:Pollen-specific protein C13 [Nymphaea thermarum]